MRPVLHLVTTPTTKDRWVCRAAGAPGDSSYDASVRVQRLGHGQSPRASAEEPSSADHQSSSGTRGNPQQSKRRQAALHQLAARSRSRSASSSRAVSQQPSMADLAEPQLQHHKLLRSALDHDAAAARLAGDYLAAVHSAASIHSAAASSASSWPQQSDIPATCQSGWDQRKAGGRVKDEGAVGGDWEGVLRRGVELAQGPTTDQFLQVVDLYPEQRVGQVCSASCKFWQCSPMAVQWSFSCSSFASLICTPLHAILICNILLNVMLMTGCKCFLCMATCCICY